jgi:hypothetical protein
MTDAGRLEVIASSALREAMIACCVREALKERPYLAGQLRRGICLGSGACECSYATEFVELVRAHWRATMATIQGAAVFA